MQNSSNLDTQIIETNKSTQAIPAAPIIAFANKMLHIISSESENYKVIRRNRTVTKFEPSKISSAITKAFLATSGSNDALPERIRELIDQLTHKVIQALLRSKAETFHIEDIQDQVELALMRVGEHAIARSYVLYREKRAQERVKNKALSSDIKPNINVIDNGKAISLEVDKLAILLENACNEAENSDPLSQFQANGLSTKINKNISSIDNAKLGQLDHKLLLQETLKNLYDGVSLSQVYDAAILAARTRIEQDPAYSYVAARILLHTIWREVFNEDVAQQEKQNRYINYLSNYVQQGIAVNLLDKNLLKFDLSKLGQAIHPERDLQFNYLGLQTLYDRYFLHIDERRIELPQIFFMRIAMGLALNEVERDLRAIEFYEVLSKFDFMSSTPTLFNSGTKRSQLSSCYLTTVPDDLSGIYEALKENALLSKFAGGLGNDWTSVRALGSYISGTNGKSQGVVPFLKVVNDTAVAVNQGGKRKGAVCAYLEVWHLDIEEFLELRKNTGDERRRTHDINTANWIPDLFMKRVLENGMWTLFSPSECPDLHSKFGRLFESAYLSYEAKAALGKIKLFKQVSALYMWRKMLGMLFETGHPWITFKDACNVRNPQQHVGTIHSSNLCTEITLNTNEEEIAVCNLGSVNLVAHLKVRIQNNSNLGENNAIAWELDHEKLSRTIRTAMRMLDNVIDVNYYAVEKARISNQRHRPVGLGLMGFQDCLHKLRIAYDSDEAVHFADTSMEAICYYAYLASSELAKERGCYSSYQGSFWSQAILPQDTLQLLRKERGGYVEIDTSSSMDWDNVRTHIKLHGMRNSNCVAVAPTATISNIVGVSASIEPTYQNLFVKSNLSGEFTVINPYLVRDLKAYELWDSAMVADLKYFDGNLTQITRVPQELKKLYVTAFQIDPSWLVESAARRQKWIDQAQSLNIYMSGVSGKKLADTYQLAWLRGLKTTYYLRTLSASHAEKSTVIDASLNSVHCSTNVFTDINSTKQSIELTEINTASCRLNDGLNRDTFEDCESCQ